MIKNGLCIPRSLFHTCPPAVTSAHFAWQPTDLSQNTHKCESVCTVSHIRLCVYRFKYWPDLADLAHPHRWLTLCLEAFNHHHRPTGALWIWVEKDKHPPSLPPSFPSSSSPSPSWHWQTLQGKLFLLLLLCILTAVDISRTQTHRQQNSVFFW